MNTLGDVIAETQGLLGDPDGEWVTRDYILPFINTTYNLQRIAIKLGARRTLEQVIEIQNIPIGTTTLYPLQAKGKPLQGLYDPLEMFWKVAGQSPNCYAPAFPRGTLPFVGPPGAPTNTFTTGLYFTWIGNQLRVTPLATPVDILLYGRFNPPPLTDDAQELALSPDLQSPLSLGAAALAGVERTNPAILQGYATESEAAINNIIADLITQGTLFPKRLGRQAPQCGWGWNR